MSLTTLAALKAHLGITGTASDTLLTQIIRGCSGAIRDYCNGTEFGGLISANSAVAASVVTAIGHGLKTGDTVVIAGSNSTPTIDGSRVVTVLTEDTFSVPVTVTVAGTAGYFYRTVTEYLSGDGTRWLRTQRGPVHSITSLYLDDSGYWGQGENAFASGTLLESTQYALKLDNNPGVEKSKSGLILRVDGVWPRPLNYRAGSLTPVPGPETGNIKLTHVCGWAPIPAQYQLAMHQFCAIVRSIRTKGREIQAEAYDYYNYTLAPAADQDKALGSVRQLLGSARRWVW